MSKLNSLLADVKATLALRAIKEDETVTENARLSKIILRIEFANQPAGIPIYAFVKRSGNLYAVVDIKSGNVTVVGNENIASLTKVKGNFEIDGVCYGLEDTLNGWPRYRALRDTKPKKRRQNRTDEI